MAKLDRFGLDLVHELVSASCFQLDGLPQGIADWSKLSQEVVSYAAQVVGT